jgi:outer membrane receptor protein involved in Fe transport
LTYVRTANPIVVGSANALRIIDTEQPFVSKRGYTLAGMYEDDKMSARLTYTWRSNQVLFGVSPNPIDGRYIGGFGIVDASFNYELGHGLTPSLNASNLTNRGLNRFVGEPGDYATGLERQHYVNGRNYALGLRYKFN